MPPTNPLPFTRRVLDRRPTPAQFAILIALLVVAILTLATLIVAGIHRSAYRGQLQAVMGFVDQGYEATRGGGNLIVREPLEGPQVLAADRVRVQAPVHGHLAILAPVADLHAPVHGDLHFQGQVLTLHPGCVVDGDLTVDTQILDVQGTVRGRIRGTYAFLQGRRADP